MTLLVPGLMALLSLPVCLIFGEYSAIPGFLVTAGVSLALGGIPTIGVRSRHTIAPS